MHLLLQVTLHSMLVLIASSMTLKPRQDELPAPVITNISAPGPRNVYIEWERVPEPPQGVILKGINVYIEGGGLGTSKDTLPPDAQTYARDDLTPRTGFDAWLCADYQPTPGEVCTVRKSFATGSEPEGTLPVPTIGGLRADGPYTISVDIEGGSGEYSFYAVVVKSDSGYNSDTHFDNPDKLDHMTVRVDGLPPGDVFTVWVKGCSKVLDIFDSCSDPGPRKTVETPCINNACLFPFVWREAVEGDVVCVTTQVRSDCQNDNDHKDERREPNGGEFGPDTCKQGYVWREVTPDDHVCVTPQTRDLMQELNASANERVNPKCVA